MHGRRGLNCGGTPRSALAGVRGHGISTVILLEARMTLPGGSKLKQCSLPLLELIYYYRRDSIGDSHVPL
uniref:OO_Ba0013J05-OO_Ba0033A15.28 protein n=1 Tax=Oryza officinalis TaxID=4535 RepID=D0ABH1_9ORYZ|nr:OO_Ba0013J05-OO_Ba0033A15.28 [Oryza officinalis]